jgi:hypothetical protein
MVTELVWMAVRREPQMGEGKVLRTAPEITLRKGYLKGTWFQVVQVGSAEEGDSHVASADVDVALNAPPGDRAGKLLSLRE